MSSKKRSLGEILKQGRISNRLTQSEVAKQLKLGSAQSISDWERGYAGSIPVQSLKKLVKWYQLDEGEVYDALFEFEMEKLASKLSEEFYGEKRRGAK